MVQTNVAALLCVAFGIASVSGASIRNLEIQARGAELVELVEARDIAYSEYEARELELNRRADELEARGFDTEVLLLFRRNQPIDKKFKASVLSWLAEAQGAFQYGEGSWRDMHSGTTSREPNCRPSGLRREITSSKGKAKKGDKAKAAEYSYQVKLECVNAAGQTVTVVPAFELSRGTVMPTAGQMYHAFSAKVQAM